MTVIVHYIRIYDDIMTLYTSIIQYNDSITDNNAMY
jgi:hypothetical protein